jgi:hypothetical protein
MDREVAIILVLVAAIGMLAMLVIVHRERVATRAALESPFAASTEGGTRCPKCGMGNLWTENFISCGTRLPS